MPMRPLTEIADYERNKVISKNLKQFSKVAKIDTISIKKKPDIAAALSAKAGKRAQTNSCERIR